jgi:hypothetical protein
MGQCRRRFANDAVRAARRHRPHASDSMPASELADPRAWASPRAPGDAGVLHEAAAAAIAAPTAREADAFDASARALLSAAIARRDGVALAQWLGAAPSAAVARHLRRLLSDIERDGGDAAGLRTTLFALPLIVVAALTEGEGTVTLDGVLGHAQALAGMLRDARAFAGCETLALGNAVVGADAIDIRALPTLLARALLPESAPGVATVLDLPPAPMELHGATERVFLRFVVGAVLTPPGVDPLGDTRIGQWGSAMSRALTDVWRVPGVSLLALPRPPQRLVQAVQAGRSAQREVSAQIFASNAIRALRASYGEPTAFVSAHRRADAEGGGELRVSLSSPFAPKTAEGFRCPIYAYETVAEVGATLEALLVDCRVTDVRFLAGVHADVDPVTGGRLFFKDADALTPARPQ